jgi:PHD/YefM family antitoxin component YafN of YafNO toxin-antitoxin module
MRASTVAPGPVLVASELAASELAASAQVLGALRRARRRGSPLEAEFSHVRLGVRLYACSMLPSMERIISVTDLVRNAARIAEEVEAGAVYRITRGGRGSMVLIDEEYFDGWMAALDEMRRPDWREVLVEARRDAAAGRGSDLDAIAKELNVESPPHRKGRSAATRASRARGKKGR